MLEPSRSTIELVAAGAAAGAMVAPSEAAVLWIPSSVLLAACTGALLGLAYAPRSGRWQDIRSTALPSRLVKVALLALTLAAVAVVSGWVVVTLPTLPRLGWTRVIPSGPLAGLLAFSGQHWLPRAINAGKAWIDRRAKE